jgi:predicted small lipoprotein YifL
MKLGGSSYFRRSVMLAAACILAVVLTACTGKGGGYLPPGPYVSDSAIDQAVIDKFGVTSFTGQAPFGFTFSCEDKGGLNPPTGQLAIELAYSDQGTSALLSAPFSIHGIVDEIDPVLESMICIGPNPPSPLNELIFLGRYRAAALLIDILRSLPRQDETVSLDCLVAVVQRTSRTCTSSMSPCGIAEMSAVSRTQAFTRPAAFTPWIIAPGLLAAGSGDHWIRRKVSLGRVRVQSARPDLGGDFTTMSTQERRRNQGARCGQSPVMSRS